MLFRLRFPTHTLHYPFCEVQHIAFGWILTSRSNPKFKSLMMSTSEGTRYSAWLGIRASLVLTSCCPQHLRNWSVYPLGGIGLFARLGYRIGRGIRWIYMWYELFFMVWVYVLGYSDGNAHKTYCITGSWSGVWPHKIEKSEILCGLFLWGFADFARFTVFDHFLNFGRHCKWFVKPSMSSCGGIMWSPS